MNIKYDIDNSYARTIGDVIMSAPHKEANAYAENDSANDIYVRAVQHYRINEPTNFC